MSTAQDTVLIDSDFRPQAALWIAIGSVPLVAPFAVLHFFQQRPALGGVALGVIAVVFFNAWYLSLDATRRFLLPRLFIAAVGILVDLYLLATQGTSGLLWGYPTVLWIYCTLPEKAARVANGTLLAASLPLIGTVASADIALRAMATLVGVSIFTCVLIHIISRQQERLQRQLRHDPLTGLLNRRSLDMMLENAMARSSRESLPMTLLAIDLDHFKRINDDFGHAAGDQVLQNLGKFLRGWLCAKDVAFRLGGEEFLVLLHDTSDVEAYRVAESMVAGIRETSLLDARTVTASIGYAPFSDAPDAKAWMREADEALYLAKRAGRDRVATGSGSICSPSPGRADAVSRPVTEVDSAQP